MARTCSWREPWNRPVISLVSGISTTTAKAIVVGMESWRLEYFRLCNSTPWNLSLVTGHWTMTAEASVFSGPTPLTWYLTSIAPSASPEGSWSWRPCRSSYLPQVVEPALMCWQNISSQTAIGRMTPNLNPKNKLKLKVSQDFNLLISRVKAETLIIKHNSGPSWLPGDQLAVWRLCQVLDQALLLLLILKCLISHYFP